MPKTITIKKTVYDELLAFKKENESFSELLDRLVKSQYNRELLLSLRGSVKFEDKEKLLKDIQEKR
ncbi:MAG: antitoxin VapB family protein [Cuniculiplasma sp.]